MDITHKNTNRILLLIAISLVISLSMLFQEQLKVAGTYIAHWAYVIAPSCRQCEMQSATIGEATEISFGLPEGWSIEFNEDRTALQLTHIEGFSTLTAIKIFEMNAAQREIYETEGFSDYALDWMDNLVEPKAGDAGKVSKFGRQWEYLVAEAGIRFGSVESSRPFIFELYISEDKDAFVQIVTMKEAFQFRFNLKEQDQLDMILNSLEFE